MMQKQDKEAELKKEMWMRYLIARVFANEPPVDKEEYVPVQPQPEPVKKTMPSLPDNRFSALRAKLESAQKEPELADGSGQ